MRLGDSSPKRIRSNFLTEGGLEVRIGSDGQIRLAQEVNVEKLRRRPSEEARHGRDRQGHGCV